MLKLNSDAAVKKGGLGVGLGAVIRNEKADVVAALSKFLHGDFSPEVGECLALREGLLLADMLKVDIPLVEVDACRVADAVNAGICLLSDAGTVIDDIRAFSRVIGVQKCLHVSRNLNVVAHDLCIVGLLL